MAWRRLLSASAVCAVLAADGSAVGAQVAGADGWSRAVSDHFEVFARGDAQHARQAAIDFERIHAAFVALLTMPSGSWTRTRLVVFGTPKEFEPYKPTQTSNAFWLAAPDGDFIVVHSLAAGTQPVALHEYAHLVMNRLGAAYPMWLDEGLAEFYSTMKFDGARARLGAELPHAVAALSAPGAFIPLPRLLAMDAQSAEVNDPRAASVVYAEAWALTHMLLMRDPYRAQSSTLFAALARGASSADTLTRIYGKSLDAIGFDLRRYLSGLRVPSTVVAVGPGPAAAQVSSTPVDEVDMSATLASLLGWQHGHETEARAAMIGLEGRAPKNLRVAEARALLEHYTQHCVTARAYLERAVKLGSSNPAVLRALASLTSAPRTGGSTTGTGSAAPSGLGQVGFVPCGAGG